MKIAPIPSDARIIPGRTSLAYEPLTGIRAKRSSPRIVSTMPATVTGRTPILGAKVEASPAEIMIPAVKGRKATPAFNGPKPSARWMYCVLKKNIANIPEKARNIERFAVVSERTRKIESRTSGSAERCSIRTNPTRSAAAATNETIDTVEPQPCWAELTSPYTSSIRPPVTVTAPARS